MHIPEVIIFNFQKSEADLNLKPEKRRVRFGKSVIPPVLFLHGEVTGEAGEVDGLFMRPVLSDRIQSVRIED